MEHPQNRTLVWIVGSVGVLLIPAVTGLLLNALREHDQKLIVVEARLEALRRDYDSGPNAAYRSEQASLVARFLEEHKHLDAHLLEVGNRLDVIEKKLEALR